MLGGGRRPFVQQVPERQEGKTARWKNVRAFYLNLIMVTVSTVMSHEKEEEEERRVPPTYMAGMEWELETEEEEEKATSCWQQRWRRTTTTVEKSEGEEEVEDGDFEFRRRSQWERLQSRQEQGQSQAASATVSTSSSRPRPYSSSTSPPAHSPRPSRPRRLSVSKGVEGCEASAAQWAALRALLVLSVALLPSATVHSFVAFDRTSSCVRAFGCSEELVGFLLEVRNNCCCTALTHSTKGLENAYEKMTKGRIRGTVHSPTHKRFFYETEHRLIILRKRGAETKKLVPSLHYTEDNIIDGP